MTTATRTKHGFKLANGDKSAEFTIGVYGARAYQDVTDFENGGYCWTVEGLGKLAKIGLIGSNEGFAHAPKLFPILTAVGILARPAATAPTKAVTTATPATVAPPSKPAAGTPATPIVPAAKVTTTPKALAPDDPATVAERINGRRQSAENEQALADNGWADVIANLNRRT